MASFKVKAKDRQSKKEVEFDVTANSNIQTQQDAEKHVAEMPAAWGGKHPGFDVVKTPAEVAPVETTPE